MKKPAFGKRIWTARAAGRHPPEILAFLGGSADLARDRPCAAYIHHETRPGELDWRIAAGVPVTLFDHRRRFTGSGDQELLWWLAEEIAAWSSYLVLASQLAIGEWAALVDRMPDVQTCQWFRRERYAEYLERRATWLAERCERLDAGHRPVPGWATSDPVGGGRAARDRRPSGGGVVAVR